jgi:hypothetical protein
MPLCSQFNKLLHQIPNQFIIQNDNWLRNTRKQILRRGQKNPLAIKNMRKSGYEIYFLPIAKCPL